MTRINTTGDKQDRQAMPNSLPHLRNQVSLALSSRCAAPQLMRSAASGLTVNQPGDHYEQEAERVAEQVMRIEEPRMVRAPGAMSGTQRRLQRKCSGCEEEEKNKLHRKENGAGPGKAPSIVHEVLRSPG
ncbi:MAG TPA: hypothetical protein VG649_15475, partial [Candidatus Angelobacter sp.]|nr:hypothetical protein [Candidatus Angelobacter sp.]